MQEANNDCTYHGCGAIAIIFVPLSKLRSLNVKDNFNNTFSVKSFLTPPLWPRNSGANLTQNNQITKQTTTNPYYFLRHTYGKRSTSGKENCKSGTLPGCLATYLSNIIPHTRDNYVLTIQKSDQKTTKLRKKADEGSFGRHALVNQFVLPFSTKDIGDDPYRCLKIRLKWEGFSKPRL